MGEPLNRRTARTISSALLAALAVACGGADGAKSSGSAQDQHDHGAHPAASADRVGRTIAVRGKAVRFDPDRLTAKAGETFAVQLTAEDAEHDFRIDELAVHAHADKGGTTAATIKTDKPGTYRYYCSVDGHLEAGMKGELVVTG